MVEYADFYKLYTNAKVLRVLEGFLDKYKEDERVEEWYNMLARAKGFVSSFYEDELEAIVLKVLSGMFFNGEYFDKMLERLGNCNTATVLKTVYSNELLGEYIIVPIYKIAVGETNYKEIAKSMGHFLTNKKAIESLKEEKQKLEEELFGNENNKGKS